MGCGREESVVLGNALQSLKAAEAGLFLHPYGSYFPRERSAFMGPWMLSPMLGSSQRNFHPFLCMGTLMRHMDSWTRMRNKRNLVRSLCAEKEGLSGEEERDGGNMNLKMQSEAICRNP